MLAQAGGLAAVVLVLMLVGLRHRFLERKVQRMAEAPVPGRTRDLPAAQLPREGAA